MTATTSPALFSLRPPVFSDLAEGPADDGPPQPAGCAIWHYTFSTCRAVATNLPSRISASVGRGIGEALLRHWANRGFGDGVARFTWRLQHRNLALPFYRAMGPRFLDDRKTRRIPDGALERSGEPG